MIFTTFNFIRKDILQNDFIFILFKKIFNFIKKNTVLHSINVISILLKRMQIYYLRGKCFNFFIKKTLENVLSLFC